MVDISTCIISYNQQDFIAQAIEGALMQKGDFSHEIIICDDASTDNTPQIIEQYAARFPDRIKSYPATTNLGMHKNWAKSLQLCSGKYIALLEGDDYWTDENKLAKQFQILETHPDCVISFTNARIQYDNGPAGHPDYVTLNKDIFTIAELMNFNFLPTCSVLMRNKITNNFFPPAYFKSPFADWIVHVINAQNGNIHFLKEFTCTYRVHGNGIWAGTNKEKQLINNLNGLICVGSVVANNKKLMALLRQSKETNLQKLCAFYMEKGDYKNYLSYRLKLLLN